RSCPTRRLTTRSGCRRCWAEALGKRGCTGTPAARCTQAALRRTSTSSSGTPRRRRTRRSRGPDTPGSGASRQGGAEAPALPRRCTVLPGDALFLPAYWHQQRRSFGGPDAGARCGCVDAAVDFWYRAPPRYTRSRRPPRRRRRRWRGRRSSDSPRRGGRTPPRAAAERPPAAARRA
ncbi:unnamed protein product, partial [Prorocentrum cordatum]